VLSVEQFATFSTGIQKSSLFHNLGSDSSGAQQCFTRSLLDSGRNKRDKGNREREKRENEVHIVQSSRRQPPGASNVTHGRLSP